MIVSGVQCNSIIPTSEIFLLSQNSNSLRQMNNSVVSLFSLHFCSPASCACQYYFLDYMWKDSDKCTGMHASV